ncbi:MAG: mannose-1-phosphate guanylyltransferase [Candidatus Gracilibacteria bacterium]
MKAVILAGGHGTRLYPLSTKEKPKQFVNLIGDKTLFQQTVERLSFLKPTIEPADIFVATNKEFVHLVKEQAPEIPPENIFEEPAMRNTATCIGFAAMQLSKKFPDEVMCIVYADHLIHDKEEFARCLRAAELLAKEENTLNIIEVEATSPNTNLGWVRMGKLLREIKDPLTGQPSVGQPQASQPSAAKPSVDQPVKIYEFIEFKEKPDLETAKKYLESGDYLWNTGFYVWKVSTILEKYRLHFPETYARLMKMRDNPSCIATEYPLCESISIDYAIMEKVAPEEVRIIPAKLGWSDIGTWETLFDELEKVGDFDRIERFKKIREAAIASPAASPGKI